MAHLVGVRDEVGWPVDRIPLDRHVTFTVVGEFGVIHGLAFDLLPFKAQISWTYEANNMEEGCFHIASLTSRLRYPFPGFILDILGVYGIAPSELAPSLWRIMSFFF